MTKGEKDASSGGGLVPGLLSGMVTTARQMLAPMRTAEYPDVPPTLPARRGGLTPKARPARGDS